MFAALHTCGAASAKGRMDDLRSSTVATLCAASSLCQVVFEASLRNTLRTAGLGLMVSGQGNDTVGNLK